MALAFSAGLTARPGSPGEMEAVLMRSFGQDKLWLVVGNMNFMFPHIYIYNYIYIDIGNNSPI